MSKPRFYIAAPFFSDAQTKIVGDIEVLLMRKGYPFYSPRKDSGSASLTAEQRRNPESWKPVFQSNVEELARCDIMLAVIEYAQPENLGVFLCRAKTETDITGRKTKFPISGGTPLEVPDSGVVWEMGRFHGLGKPIVAYHSSSTRKLNLMLSHSTNGFLRGMANLEDFLEICEENDMGTGRGDACALLNWEAAKGWSDDVE